ncbi:hypothetical protein Tco_0033162 [Tanacetum coccineum]
MLIIVIGTKSFQGHLWLFGGGGKKILEAPVLGVVRLALVLCVSLRHLYSQLKLIRTGGCEPRLGLAKCQRGIDYDGDEGGSREGDVKRGKGGGKEEERGWGIILRTAGETSSVYRNDVLGWGGEKANKKSSIKRGEDDKDFKEVVLVVEEYQTRGKTDSRKKANRVIEEGVMKEKVILVDFGWGLVVWGARLYAAQDGGAFVVCLMGFVLFTPGVVGGEMVYALACGGRD